MANIAEFRTKVWHLEMLLKASADVPDDQFESSRRDEVRLRRETAKQNSDIAELGEAALPTKELRDAFRIEVSKLRRATALHLSSWPVVLIDLRDDRYKASVAKQREAYRIFIEWVSKNAAG